MELVTSEQKELENCNEACCGQRAFFYYPKHQGFK